MKITHVSTTDSHGQWEPIMFVLRNEQGYHFGIENRSFSEEEISVMVSQKRLKKLKVPLSWNNGLAVWRTNGDYRLASKRNPADDPESVLIEFV